MTRFLALAPALAIAAAFAAPASAQMDMQPSMQAAMNQAIPYLALAGEGDVYEITSSQIAIMRSQNPEVRTFATTLIDHHTRTTNMALAAAKSAGVMPPPPVLDAPHRDMITQLLAASPADFDRVYIQQQIPAHQMALSLHQGYAASGDTAELRTTARGAVPIVQGHLQRAQALQSGM